MAKEKTKDKDKILEEISKKLKEIQNEEPDEEPEKSELEEDVDLIENSFSQFIPSLHFSEDTTIPVLERVASEQPRPIFVGTMPQTSVEASGETSGKDDFKYVPSQEGNSEPKYVEKDSTIFREPERVDFTRVGREPERLISERNQGVSFMRSESFSQIESSASERTWSVERIDSERAGRGDPFEKEKEKYKTYKPKVPKGY